MDSEAHLSAASVPATLGGRKKRVRGQHASLDPVVAADASLVCLGPLLGKTGTTRLKVIIDEDILARLPWQAAIV